MTNKQKILIESFQILLYSMRNERKTLGFDAIPMYTIKEVEELINAQKAHDAQILIDSLPLTTKCKNNCNGVCYDCAIIIKNKILNQN